MSPEKQENKSPDPDEIWNKVLLREKEGKLLTDSEKRALELRRITLDAVDAMEAIVEDPTLEDDALRQADVIAVYWESILKLQDMGITEEIHVGRDQEVFSDPLVVAEWYAGQLIGIETDKITSARQAFLQIEEHSAEQVQFSEDESLSVIEAKTLTPSFKNWSVARSVVNLGRHFLASNLDKYPQN